MPNIVQSNNQKLKQSQNESINEICRESQTVLSFKELPSQIRLLSLNMKKALFPQSLFNCNNNSYKLYAFIYQTMHHQIMLFGI